MTHHGFSNSAKTFAKDVSQSRLTDSMVLDNDMPMNTDVLEPLPGETDMHQRQGKHMICHSGGYCSLFAMGYDCILYTLLTLLSQK